MAIDKKLIHFKTKENFMSANGVNNSIDTPTSGSEEEGNAEYGQIKGTSIVFVKDSKEIWTHGNLYKSVNWSVLKNFFVKKENVVAGDLYVVDSSGNKRFMRFSDRISAETLLEEQITPIGVVVIPTSHNVYGTGECAIVSLNTMSCNTPDTGNLTSSLSTIYWGGYNIDTSLTNYDVVNVLDINSQDSEMTIISCGDMNYWGHRIPSDAFSGADCLADQNAKYYNTQQYVIPSPYLTDGSRNLQYYDTSLSEFNAPSDFNGIDNTKVLLDLSTSQLNWKTDNYVNNNFGSSLYPAACCCWRYSTKGTSQGDWYLPAAGELGYFIARQGAVKDSIQKLIDKQIIPNYFFADDSINSSSEFSKEGCVCVSMYNGYIGQEYKNFSCATYAFIRA